MATESNSRDSSGGIRTYRGRTIDEILPQIRDELGPDAIILREREGLVGGVGGFFAQRFIEVDARRGGGSSIDIYDDAPDDELPAFTPSFGDEPIEAREGTALLPPEPVELRPRQPILEPERPMLEPERPVSPAPRRFTPPVVDPEPPAAPSPRRFETEVFMARLREASKVLPDDGDDYEPLSSVATPDPEAIVRERPRPVEPEFEPEPESELEPEPEVRPARKPRQRPEPRPAPERKRAERKPRAKTERKPRQPRRKAEPELEPTAQAQPLDWSDALLAPESATAFEPTVEPPAAAPVASAPVAEPKPEPVNPYETVRRRPHSVRESLTSAPAPAPLPVERPTTQAPAPIARVAPSAPAPQTRTTAAPTVISPARPVPPAPARVAPSPAPLVSTPAPAPAAKAPVPGRRAAARHEDGIRGVIDRLFGGWLHPDSTPHPSAPKPLDTAAAAAAITDLSARGASQAWASQLVTAVGAHGAPLAGSLREAAEAEVARRILPAPALPITGAAIAFIGAGGTGKTRCTAALASAYRRASTLAVTVIALDNPEGARELKRMLRDDDVPVLSLSGERAQQAIANARDGGLVIVDTTATTPTDAAAVQGLGETLIPLGLDAVYVALPATLGPQAARRALASFGALSPTAVTITHADETDQLAVVIEIAIAHRIPLAYLHSGTDHQTALSSVDPKQIAHLLLP